MLKRKTSYTRQGFRQAYLRKGGTKCKRSISYPRQAFRQAYLRKGRTSLKRFIPYGIDGFGQDNFAVLNYCKISVFML